MIYNRKEKTYYDSKKSKFLSILYKYRIGHLILNIINKRFCSNIINIFMNLSISKLLIKKVISENNINMEDFKIQKYHNFNQFFNRRIKKESRPLPKDKNLLLSPCDAKLSIYKINDKLKITIKNVNYTVNSLLKDDGIAKEYQDGLCLIFRLGIEDYHYYHFIDDGKVLKNNVINGVFHSVRPVALEKFPVFAENNREWALLKTKMFGNIVYMEVGALGVGKIVNNNVKSFKRGEEKGHFKFGGSTIVILIKRDTVSVENDILEQMERNNEVQVKLFEVIGIKK